MSSAPIRLTSDVSVSSEHPPLVIAEVSGNHNGDLGRALAIVDAAAEAGAPLVKFQTYTADTITIDSDRPEFLVGSDHALWGARRLYDLYREAHTPWSWHEQLFARAREHGMVPFSSPFDATAVDLLESLGSDIYKIASLEIGDLALLRTVARTGKPVVLSNGAATLEETALAIETIRAEGNEQIVLLHCSSSYPASPAESNLRAIPTLRDAFDVQIGLSDHTPGIGVPVAAVALGATVIEKHVTLARADGGVDSGFSLEPDELASLVRETRAGWEALGQATPRITSGEQQSRALRRSLYVVSDVQAGDTVTAEVVRSIRPAGGLEPRELSRVIGRRFTADAAAGTPLSWDLL
ncbi:pseudaminic acid synthase [Schumannella soli]|uniref:Pseudaminic acid synthase n=1 Tax=Schumannella soli TaxID=2590779 RepID=A0A506Y5E6_9MICO|nr:pseudaminic acid synthase [Schumannella soli]TPW77245.1 pseudaminic acid synthase [Schumannella soli]